MNKKKSLDYIRLGFIMGNRLFFTSLAQTSLFLGMTQQFPDYHWFLHDY
mgnify:CR=1 FL=1